jgi:type I restriction enzyme S subunit
MELTKTRFKQSEVGMIPEDWEICQFKDVADKNVKWSITGGPFGSNLKTTDYTDSGVQIIQLQNIGDGCFHDESIIFTSEAKANELKSCNIFPDEIILSKMGDPVARACFVPEKAVRFIMASDGIRLVVDENRFSKYFVFTYINSKYFRNKAIEVSTGSTRQRIGLPKLKSIAFIKPPLTEQKAIASALSDVDELIAKLEKLIEKKKAIKQGAMQALLTPKEDWKEFSIFELADNRKDLFDDGDWIEAEHITDSGIRLIQTGNIGVGVFKEKDAKKYIYEESFNRLNCKLLQAGDLLICRLADPAGRACIFPEIGERRVITSVDVTIFRPLESKVNRIFLMNVLSTPNWFKQVTERVGGTTHKRISRGALGKLKVKLPIINQQNVSAEILSDVDNEIFAYEKAKSKIERLKQGMMQELLTGRTRLV